MTIKWKGARYSTWKQYYLPHFLIFLTSPLSFFDFHTKDSRNSRYSIDCTLFVLYKLLYLFTAFFTMAKGGFPQNLGYLSKTFHPFLTFLGLVRARKRLLQGYRCPSFVLCLSFRCSRWLMIVLPLVSVHLYRPSYFLVARSPIHRQSDAVLMVSMKWPSE